jgi:heme/copper-type cytochrome/quinol oxidase subunit 4
MKSRREEIIVPFILALTLLIIFGSRVAYSKMANAEMLGILIGLLLGQIGIHLYGIASINDKYKKLSQRYYLVAVVGVVLITAFFSKYFSFGYFGGFGLIVCFGHSFHALIESKGTSIRK